MAQAIEELFLERSSRAPPSNRVLLRYLFRNTASRKAIWNPSRSGCSTSDAGDRHPPRGSFTESAVDYFSSTRKDPYKVEILEDTLKDTPKVSIYHQDGFADLAAVRTSPNTSKLKAAAWTNISASF
ncbi:unnamed protein product [Porites lobata]|uniref:Uncharacterized protein n=1 Tax=Porites lobata TaxID=104759 RepID=A0ABN8SGC5_9CNID|nr:unnamed protein product [Porites lobata]